MTDSKRYIVTESFGYRITFRGDTSHPRPRTEVLVLDRDYCHKVVWSSWSTKMPRRYRRKPELGSKGQLIRKGWTTKWATARLWPTERAREYAHELCDQLNAEDEAWLAS